MATTQGLHLYPVGRDPNDVHEAALGLELIDRDGLHIYISQTIDLWEPGVLCSDQRDHIVVVGQLVLDEVQRTEDSDERAVASYFHRLWSFRLFRINDLPTEIVSIIFHDVVHREYPRDRLSALLHVSWTCKKWRDIAVCDSTLWNKIYFRGGQIEQALVWFERARHAPLDIVIESSVFAFAAADEHSEYSASVDDSIDEDPDSTSVVTEISPEALMRALLQHLFTKRETIRLLDIQLNDWQESLLVFHLLGTFGPLDARTLQSFQLRVAEADAVPAVTIAEPFLGGHIAPSLTRFALEGAPMNWGRSVMENLTTFDIKTLPVAHSIDIHCLREILSKSPRLQRLSVYGITTLHPPATRMAPIELEHLHTLMIGDFLCDVAIFLLSQLTAPNLAVLMVVYLCAGGEEYAPLFEQLTSAFPKVQSLTTSSIRFCSSPTALSSMIQWLESMLLLTYLRVADVPPEFFGLFFRRIHPIDGVGNEGGDHSSLDASESVDTVPDGDAAPAPAPVAPLLKTLDCEAVEPHIIVQWVVDRASLGTPLSKVYASEEIFDNYDQTDSERLTSICILSKLDYGVRPEEDLAYM
ncbi:hypothetical protein B0H16DRAFT_1712830 [Mycena metata]|uniref:F-box domain-containing protein n=1 Tax=Mycena metata TaxID=1033252 RepID=A0AAD7K1P0_9AGAR|nr:hypothetical protein B0H16DRAFT_1712830 [Mycena metata]